MKAKPAISDNRMLELQEMAKAYFATIQGMTEDPFEALTVITMMHLILWLNSGQGPTEAMLKDYCDNFMTNVRANEKEMN